MAFTARTETYFDASTLSDPFDATVNKPTDTAEGDILFALVCWYGSAVTIDGVPSGWTLLANYTAQIDRYALYYKLAGASEPSSYTWSLTASAKVRIVCSCYTSGDFNASDPIDVVSNTAYRVADQWLKAASMTVASANSPLVFLCSRSAGATITFTKPTTPTDTWVEDNDAGSTVSDFWEEICSMIWAGSGSTTSMDAYMSPNAATTKHAFAVALKPAGASAPTRSRAFIIG